MQHSNYSDLPFVEVKMDVRVLDYLDDKLQSSADLETLDSLLEIVKTQQGLLKKQVSADCIVPETLD